MKKALSFAVFLLAAAPAGAQIRVSGAAGEAGDFGGAAAVTSRILFSAQANQLIGVLQGAGLGVPASAPIAAPVVALDAARALEPAVRASPAALAAPARELAAALARPESLSALEMRLDAPTFARLSELHAEIRRRPEVLHALTQRFMKSEGEDPFGRAHLDATFDNSESVTDEATLVVAGATGPSLSRLSKPAEKNDAARARPAPPAAALLKKAGFQVAGWVAAALAFGAGIHHFLGGQAFSEYLTTYAIEWSMSLDNLVVISAALMAMPERVRVKALRWGLIGTVAARFAMVAGGVGLVASAHWVFIGFGLFLLATALKMAAPKLDVLALAAGWLKKILPRGAGRLGETLSRLVPSRLKSPLALGIAAVVGYGVIFALDSVPAALAISKNWFVIFSANAFSVMGLGALFSVVAWLNGRFAHLPKGVAAVLAFVGLKMLLEPLLGISIGATSSLLVIAALLGGSALYSLAAARR